MNNGNPSSPDKFTLRSSSLPAKLWKAGAGGLRPNEIGMEGGENGYYGERVGICRDKTEKGKIFF